ncbi:AAA family ATPase [Hydromonas duriensis]|uniref:Uncharacterized protein n=1 Tax=Hydromonas duriensis TaxID=1527608 RepID=A0A4R6Y246_9BURK|nr:AAA family ATPase [Hydromonas duriensis]TDR30306.1 hypothetical protein DFR44_12330 [Hydromonas duriensis]
MLVTKFVFRNLYSFENFEVDLTYPKPLKFTTIEHENLFFAPRFKVKRVCIISGGNATGKTALGKLLCAAMNIISGRQSVMNLVKIRDNQQEASLTLEFVHFGDHKLHQVELYFKHSQESENVELVKISHRSTAIKEHETQNSSRKRLYEIDYDSASLKDDPEINLFMSLSRKVHYGMTSSSEGWSYLFYENTEQISESMKIKGYFNLERATKILKAFDPTIKSIKILSEKGSASKEISELDYTPNAYQIEFDNDSKLVVDNNNWDNVNFNQFSRLSKGTSEALSIIYFIETIIMRNKSSMSSTLFLDERMAHVHTELEVSMLNVMISKLGRDSQFFYTTHNTDLLSMNIPVHSHLFLKRNEKNLVEAVQPEKFFKKNDRALGNYVKNDIFATCPDTSLIDEIAYGD